MSFVSAAIGVGASLIGSAFADDPMDGINQANAQANALAKEQFDYQKETQAPYRKAGEGALGLISKGLGVVPRVETREAIRARLQGNRPNRMASSSFGGNPAGMFGKITGMSTSVVDRDRQQAMDALGLTADDMRGGDAGDAYTAGENSRKIDAWLASQGLVDNSNLDAEVEAEYQRQLAEASQAQNSEGFNEFNRDFTAKDFDVNVDAGAKFRQEEANKALQRAYAGSGSFLSGGALKGISKYNQNLASEEYNNAFNRFNTNKTNRFNRLASVAGLGQVSANQLGANAGNYASAVGDNITNTGSAMASSQLYGARQLNNVLSSAGDKIANYFNKPATPNPLAGFGGSASDPWYG